MHTVVRYVDRAGFRRLPVPLETSSGATSVYHDNTLWQLEPWLPGAPDRAAKPAPARLRAALAALARFHIAASSLPRPATDRQVSPGIAARRQRLAALREGGAERLRAAVRTGGWPELKSRAHRLLDAFERGAAEVGDQLRAVADLRVPLQPCLRDIWSDHILFVGNRVTGVIDYGAMRVDNVATDASRLLGSLAGNDVEAWHLGLAAYQSVRPMQPPEESLVGAFDRSGLLMAGVQWIEWIYADGRHFEDQRAILKRIDHLLQRLDVR
jgi:homoserine kinase type II